MKDLGEELNRLWDCYHPYDKEKTLQKWQSILGSYIPKQELSRLLEDELAEILYKYIPQEKSTFTSKWQRYDKVNECLAELKKELGLEEK